MPTFSWPVFSPDSRANRIEKSQVTEIPSEPNPRQWLYVCGPDEAMTQLDLVARDRSEPSRIHENYKDDYNHGRVFRAGVPRDVRRTVALLEKVLSMRSKPHIDFSLALDWYKAPDDTLSPMQWPNTPSGELLHRSKYWDGQSCLLARRELLGVLTETISKHPLLAGADVIVTVPGHNADGKSFGEKLAKRLGRDLDKPVIVTECPAGARPQQKARATDDLIGQFAMPEVVVGSALVIDDVYHTGGTMSAVAHAARVAGADAVYGLTAVRTMRR